MSTVTGNGTAVANTSQPFQKLRNFLMSAKDQLQMAAAKHISPERLIRFALTAGTKNKALFQCQPESVGLALLTASALGIEPDGWNGHLVPYGNQCQFLPDYKGFIQLIYRNHRVKDVQAQAVYANDVFEFEYGSTARLLHVPANGDRGGLTHAWAMVRFKDGAETFVVLTSDEVDKRRKASKTSSSASSPWKQWEAEMWAKTAVKALAKRAPLGEQVERAADYDSAVDCGNLVIQGVEDVQQIAEGKDEFSLGDTNA